MRNVPSPPQTWQVRADSTRASSIHERTWSSALFQFVQRHGPEVVIPTFKDSRYALLFLVMFGAFPENSDVAQVYINALDGEYKESAKIRLCRFENQIENLSP